MGPEPTAETRIKVRVTAASDETPRIRRFELVGVDGDLPPFQAGAHVEIETGTGVSRSYSLCNDPGERHRYVLAVLREADGVASRWMHEHLQVGSELDITVPRNAFALEEEAGAHILIAGGVGITPISAMAHRLAAIGAAYRIIYCTRDAANTAFRAELIDRHGGRLVLHHDDGEASRAFDLAAELRARPAGAHVYICGPRGLIDAARAATAHWPPESVHFELFASQRQAPRPAPETVKPADQPFEVELARSGLLLQVPAEKTILEVVREAGIDAPFVCREGWCGNCRTKLLSGRPDHRDDMHEEDEMEPQDNLYICISRAMPGERLVIDR
jgi:phthalate 4,5-dioxygenase reductase subunit